MSVWFFVFSSLYRCDSDDLFCVAAGYSFFDSGDIAKLGRDQARAVSLNHLVGEYFFVMVFKYFWVVMLMWCLFFLSFQAKLFLWRSTKRSASRVCDMIILSLLSLSLSVHRGFF